MSDTVQKVLGKMYEILEEWEGGCEISQEDLDDLEFLLWVNRTDQYVMTDDDYRREALL